MADTSHLHVTPATEGDGINYGGIAWFMAILTVMTLVCAGLTVGIFKFFEGRVQEADAARAPLAEPLSQPHIADGRLNTGVTGAVPSLLITEPMNLARFRAEEQEKLTTYGWVDKGAGVVRLPIERAKALLLERGLPVRESAAPAPHAAGDHKAAPPAAAHKGGGL